MTGVTVWVVESGYYEQRAIDLVAASPEAAFAGIGARYSAPYVVRWDEPVQDGEVWRLTGHFDSVAGYSVEHVNTFTITPHEVTQ